MIVDGGVARAWPIWAVSEARACEGWRLVAGLKEERWLLVGLGRRDKIATSEEGEGEEEGKEMRKRKKK